MTFYMCLIIITELVMIAMTLHVIKYVGFTKEQKSWYIVTFVSIMLCSAAEFAVHCGYYNPKFKIILTIITVLQFSIAPLLGSFFSGALGMHKQARISAIPFSLNAFIEIVAAPFGWIFSFSDEGYSRGPYFIIYEAVYIVSLVYLLVTMVIVGRKFKHRDSVTIIMIIIILIAGIIPMTFYNLNVTYIAIAISASICYIYYNDLVQQDTRAEFEAKQKQISSMQEHIISGLANLIENRDTETGGHIYRTSTYVKKLCECCIKENVYTDILTNHYIDLLQRLAPLHDIGKIVVSDKILKKPGKLTPEEYEQMKIHAKVGGDVVREILNGITDEEYLSFASDIATCHHEKWDGSGYPKGLKENDIPLSARIMAIADVFDALVSERCYKDPIPFGEAFDIIESESGTHFDPTLVTVFLKHREEFLDFYKK